MANSTEELLAKLRLLEEKQNKLTAGAGISINPSNDTISATAITPTLQSGTKIANLDLGGLNYNLYAPTPAVRELTKAQYEALSYDEKMNNTAYFIKDVPDIKVWIGTEEEYQALTTAEKMDPSVLYCIRPLS